MSDDTQPPGTLAAAAHDLQAAVDTFGAVVAEGLAPLVAMIQDRSDALARLLPAYGALLESHGALLEFLDRQTVRPNWAQDVRTLEQARALHDRLTAPEDTTP